MARNLLLTGVTAAALGAGAVVAVGSASEDAPAAQGRHGTERLALPATGPGSAPAPRVGPGRELGELLDPGLAVAAPSPAPLLARCARAAGGAECVVRYRTRDGSVVAEGLVRPGDAATLVVVGGTGAYAGSSGRLELRRADGAGALSFRFRLTRPRPAGAG
jgi:hypothetical protein